MEQYLSPPTNWEKMFTRSATFFMVTQLHRPAFFKACDLWLFRSIDWIKYEYSSLAETTIYYPLQWETKLNERILAAGEQHCDTQLEQLLTALNNAHNSLWQIIFSLIQHNQLSAKDVRQIIDAGIEYNCHYLSLFLLANGIKHQFSHVYEKYDVSVETWRTTPALFKVVELCLTQRCPAWMTHDILFMTADEIITRIDSDRVMYGITHERRKPFTLLCHASGENKLISDKPATITPSTHTANWPVTGTPAFHGGTVEAHAIIVRHKEDLPLIKKGDILVMRSTSTWCLPVLHLVAGIITEHGGALSHAAIVSREMNIPCVIGVQSIVDALTGITTPRLRMNSETGQIDLIREE